MTPLSIVGQLGMTSAMIGLDPAAWSLVHELRISFVFPLLLFGVCRSPMLTIVAALALHLIGQPYVETETYVVFFAAGCWLAVHRRALENLSFSPASNAALGTLALACLSTQIEIVSGVGGLTILVLAQSSPFLGRVLAFRWCQRLGQVSYSLYLVHMVVLMALGRALGALLTIPLILCVAIPVIWLATEASFRWVELPSIRAGRMAVSYTHLTLPTN